MLTSTYPESPGFKTASPETSQQAAESVKSRAKTLRDKVAACLRGADLTADECAELVGESVLAVRPRLSELRKLNKIEDAGKRRKNASGHSAAVWRWIRKQAQQEFSL